MRKAKRYVVTYDGGFAAWEYRVAKESDKYENIWIKESDYATLQAENERLRKAGNAMLITAIEDSTGIWLLPAFKKWIEATEPTASDIGDIAFQTLKDKGVQS